MSNQSNKTKMIIEKERLLNELINCIGYKSVKQMDNSGYPYGKGINDALEYVLTLASDMGFITKNIDSRVGYIEYGHGDEIVGVLGHIDVVPEGTGWDTNPFIGTIKDGKLYGRGAIDDKGPILACIYGLKAIKDSNMNLKRKIRIIIGTDEESGNTDIPYYLKEERMPDISFTPDSVFPVIFSEKGIAVIRVNMNLERDNKGFNIKEASSGKATNKVPDIARFTLEDSSGNELRFFGQGISAHGSTPQDGKNAIDDIISKMKNDQNFVCFSDDLKKFLLMYNELFSYDTFGRKIGINFTDSELGSLSINVGMLQYDKNNISLYIDLRYPPTVDFEKTYSKLNKRIASFGANTELIKNKQGLLVSKENKLVEILSNIYKTMTGRDETPISTGGGTYAKTFKNTVAFGALFPGKEDTMHKANEYIEIEDLFLCAEIYMEAMIQLANT